jgi:hypothetical protein
VLLALQGRPDRYIRAMPNSSSQGIPGLVQAFVTELTGALESVVSARVQTLVLSALGTPPKRGPGRPPKNGLAVAATLSVKVKRPRQLCPVPGCKNAAAPIFGMVCSEHKDVPKAKIKQYREARRQAKAGNGRGASVRGRAARGARARAA